MRHRYYEHAYSHKSSSKNAHKNKNEITKRIVLKMKNKNNKINIHTP